MKITKNNPPFVVLPLSLSADWTAFTSFGGIFIMNNKSNYWQILDICDLKDEVWKEFYFNWHLCYVSNYGRIKKSSRKIIHRGKQTTLPEYIAKQHIQNHGYLALRFTVDGVTKNILTHTIVAKAFIPNNQNKTDVNHIDGNKQNPLPENLEWVTRSENHLHAYKIGLKKYSPKKKNI